MDSNIYHIPALLHPTVEALITDVSGIYVDATMGGAGHSREILRHLSPEGRLFGFDRDRDAITNAPDDPRFTFVHSDFRFIRNFLRFHGVDKVDGILADLGVSFHHFDDALRGFSFRADAPLDMRMNQNAPNTAAQIINQYSEKQLSDLFFIYGDLKNANKIARAISFARQNGEIASTGQLCEAVAKVINPRQEKKELAQIFQALRIEVNNELDSLRDILSASLEVLKPGGRFAVLTYHSLEDRIVKNFFRSGNFDGVVRKDFFGRPQTPWKPVGKNPITPDQQEIIDNPRSRSAKLRTAQFIGISQ